MHIWHYFKHCFTWWRTCHYVKCSFLLKKQSAFLISFVGKAVSYGINIFSCSVCNHIFLVKLSVCVMTEFISFLITATHWSILFQFSRLFLFPWIIQSVSHINDGMDVKENIKGRKDIFEISFSAMQVITWQSEKSLQKYLINIFGTSPNWK